MEDEPAERMEAPELALAPGTAPDLADAATAGICTGTDDPVPGLDGLTATGTGFPLIDVTATGA